MPINLPGDVAVDVRDPIAGDSYNWAGLEPAPAKKVIVIHATASEAPDEDGFTVASYHVNNNGWGGCGVHAVVTKDSYPGRPGQTPAGAHLQYTGDLLTWRAGVANNNPGRVHIEISGLFTPGHGVPSEAQLRATRKFIDFLLAPNNLMPSLNYYNQVDYHNHQATPGNGTACPGWQHPQFNEWFGYLQGGPEPSWWHPSPQPAPTSVPVEVVDNTPEYIKTWVHDTTIPAKVVAVPSAGVYDAVSDKVVKTLPGGEPVAQLSGYFKAKGNTYYRTQWSLDNNKWNGILQSDLKDAPTAAPLINTAPPVDSIQAPPVPEQALPELQEIPGAAPVKADSVEVGKALAELWEAVLGVLLSPLRLIGMITKLVQKGK